MTPELGAVLGGIDLRDPLDLEAVGTIRQAILDHGVIFFRDQDLNQEQMLVFMSSFGTPCIDPFARVDQPIPPEYTIHAMPTLPYRRATAVWHIDSSLAPAPASVI